MSISVEELRPGTSRRERLRLMNHPEPEVSDRLAEVRTYLANEPPQPEHGPFGNDQELRDYLAKPVPEVKMLVEGLISLRGITLLTAGPKAGKTTLAHNLVRAVVDCEPFLGRKTSNQSCTDDDYVIMGLLDLEMPNDLLHEWLSLQEIENDLAVVLSSGGSQAGHAKLWDIRKPEVAEEMVESLKWSMVRYLVIDCLAPWCRALGINENSAESLGPLLDAITYVSQEANCGILLIHHLGKNGESARGSSDLEGWPNDILQLRLDHGQRFLSAYGRTATGGEEVRLEMNSLNRHLSVFHETRVEARERREAKTGVLPVGRPSKADDKRREVESYLKDNPTASGNQVFNDLGGSRKEVLELVKEIKASTKNNLGTGTKTPSFPYRYWYPVLAP
jgi:hypothetical protein